MSAYLLAEYEAIQQRVGNSDASLVAVGVSSHRVMVHLRLPAARTTRIDSEQARPAVRIAQQRRRGVASVRDGPLNQRPERGERLLGVVQLLSGVGVPGSKDKLARLGGLSVQVGAVVDLRERSLQGGKA